MKIASSYGGEYLHKDQGLYISVVKMRIMWQYVAIMANCSNRSY